MGLGRGDSVEPGLVATREAAMDEDQIYAELDRVRDDYRALLDSATVAELRQPTDGTKWSNEQLLFHMLFGYLLVRNLRFIVWGFPCASGLGETPVLSSIPLHGARSETPDDHDSG